MAAITNTAGPNFAILGQRKLRCQADVVGTRMHNNREGEVLNADRAAPEPTVILGPVDTWKGVRDRLLELKIEPRKGAVLAIELMMTTSPGWWSKNADGEFNPILLQAFERCVMKYLRQRFAAEAIISVTLHVDESVPHYHAIIVPVRERVDGRFADRRARWMLCARGDLLPRFEKGADRAAAYAAAWRGGMGGRGHMAYEQTQFAEVCRPIKLERGRHWSGEPNKPNAVYQAELRVEREGLVRERAIVAQEADAQRAGRDDLDARAAAFATERAAWDAQRVADRARDVARAAELDAAEALMAERRRMARDWVARSRIKDAEQQALQDDLAAQERTIAQRERAIHLDQADMAARGEALSDIAEAAMEALETIDTRQLSTALKARVFHAAEILGVAIDRAAKHDVAFIPLAASRWAEAGRSA